MANYRRGRINDEMQKELAMILREVKDPRIKDAFISITAVDVTGDLKFAKVYYSAMMGDKKEIAKGLKSSAGYIYGGSETGHCEWQTASRAEYPCGGLSSGCCSLRNG